MQASAVQLTSKYQITVPKQVREDLKVGKGDKLLFVKAGQTWRLKRVPARFVDALKQVGRDLKGKPADLHKEFEEGWEDR